MLHKNTAFAILFLLRLVFATDDDEFIFNGFNGTAGWAVDGSAVILPNGILSLVPTNSSSISYSESHAFYASPFQMRNRTDGSLVSFFATFIFAILPSYTTGGIAFVLAPNTSFRTTYNNGGFGLLSYDDNGSPSNHLLCIELDTTYDKEFDDIDDSHVGININSLNSSQSSPAGYFTDDPFSNLHPLWLSSGRKMQVWIDYDHGLMQLNVSLAPIPNPKPKHPLLVHKTDLPQVFLDHMYVGFSASSWENNLCLVLGCSFTVNGKAAALDYSKLPKVNVTQELLSRARYREIREEWELEFGPHRFSYKDLFHATDGFKEKRLLGAGGFGKVYKGVLSSTKLEVAVKVMSHDSKQGMKEFIAEVVSMGRLRHRNLVQLLGYCRQKGELLLVYEYMSNGSLDKHLYDLEESPLDWNHRFDIIKGVASALLYLHEEWEQVVLHRDVKASNVLLDEDMNGQLGDFGLARLHDHGVEAHTICVAGTRGYISPELARLGKATKATDVFAFGAFTLEVACSRRPIVLNSLGEPKLLVDFVLKCWQDDLIVCVIDPRMGGEYVEEEAELVLKLGLLCLHPSPVGRPSMRLIMQYLCGDVSFPGLPDAYQNIRSINEIQVEGGFSEADLPSVQTNMTSLSGGR